MVKGAPHTGEKIEQHSEETALSRINCNVTLQAHGVDEVQESSQCVLLSPCCSIGLGVRSIDHFDAQK